MINMTNEKNVLHSAKVVTILSLKLRALEEVIEKHNPDMYKDYIRIAKTFEKKIKKKLDKADKLLDEASSLCK